MKLRPFSLCLSIAFLALGLTTLRGQSCDPLPSGAVGWWEADSNTFDTVTGSEGAWIGTPAYVNGESGPGFSFNGSHGGINVAPAAAMNFDVFTIEAWVQRASLNETSTSSTGGGAIVSHGNQSWVLAIDNTGVLYLSQDTVNGIMSNLKVTDTNYHHVAVTADGANVTFYLDGVADTPATYAPPYNFNEGVFIGANPDGSAVWLGSIDEAAVYDQALEAGDIQAIYQAGAAGKCETPIIYLQPSNTVAEIGGPALFSVASVGTWPLSYQWLSNQVAINGATNSTLALNDLVLADSGASYSVVVSNSQGYIYSLSASLTVTNISCYEPAPGLIGYWSGDGTTADSTTRDNGVLAGNATYGPGTNGLAFTFQNDGDGVVLGNPTQFQLQDFTIDCWIQRSDTNNVAADGGDAVFFSYGAGGYGFALHNNGQMFLTKIGVDSTEAIGGGITNLNFHHVAITKSGQTVMFYLDGAPVSTNTYAETFSFNTSAAIGERGDGGATFLGSIQDVSVFNRPLTSAEIGQIYNGGASAPCYGVPIIVSQPVTQTNAIGSTGDYSVLAASLLPTSYQWQMNGTNLANQTNSDLVITNLSFSNAGSYSVIVANADGPTSSTNFVLSLALGATISNQPQTETATLGGSATFSVTAAGTPPLFYQWQFEGTNIEGATNATYTVTNITFTNLGSYQVEVSNAARETNSVIAQLMFNPEISINGQLGTNFSFTNFAPTLQIATAFANGTIFYTLDGSTPDYNANLYSGPFKLEEPALVRAVAYDTNFNSAISLPVNVVVIISNALTIIQTGGGRVTINPPGSLFASTQTVEATATPSNGWVFMNWAGTVSGTTPVLEAPMTNAQEISAVFGTFVTVNTPPTNGTIFFNPANGPYVYGTIVQATAIPNAGAEFSLWGGNLSGPINPTTLQINTPEPNVAALFGALAPGHFTVTAVANGRGTITVGPNNNSYVSNAPLNVMATPLGGSRFYYWTGSTNTSLSSFRIAVRTNLTLVANFSNGVYTAQFSNPQVASNKVSFSLLDGMPQTPYEVDTSTDLVNWTALAIVTNANGTIPLVDVTTNSEQKFYRAEAQ